MGPADAVKKVNHVFLKMSSFATSKEVEASHAIASLIFSVGDTPVSAVCVKIDFTFALHCLKDQLLGIFLKFSCDGIESPDCKVGRLLDSL
jgi:hypothetical protein